MELDVEIEHLMDSGLAIPVQLTVSVTVTTLTGLTIKGSFDSERPQVPAADLPPNSTWTRLAPNSLILSSLTLSTYLPRLQRDSCHQRPSSDRRSSLWLRALIRPASPKDSSDPEIDPAASAGRKRERTRPQT
ncbi:hypothetical protein GB937_006384 [Aspergillus fischeri]|nr:hypothetical protein GB937_006384 [Aspergillus fischeri]